jgi:histidinol phosphatase-like PHP family hydrolase
MELELDLQSNRRHFIKTAALTMGAFITSPLFARNTRTDIDYDYMDLHVHTAGSFNMDRIMQLSKERRVKFGILEHPGRNYRIKNDRDLKQYIDELKKYPVYIGLQPTRRNWRKDFSEEAISQVDYILMDPQTIPNDDGSFMRIWNFDTRVDDTEVFMKKYMAHCVDILKNEPIDIFGWPLFLPVCIARDYYTIWTEDRMQTIIDLAKAKNIAIEINEMAHVPHKEFITSAKTQGLKFTFGSDARDPRAGAIVYGKRVAQACGLKKDDFFVPGKRS